MKYLINFILCCWLIPAGAQAPVLEITVDKTTSLIFPFPIRHVDRGTKDVLVQEVKEADHILLVKAASKHFPETNLSVVTGDGHLYTFAVRYVSNPSIWVYEVPAHNNVTVAARAAAIRDSPRTFFTVRKRQRDMEAKVMGIYSGEGVLYFQLQIRNEGPIDYDIDFLRFYIRDKKTNKHAASQEIELLPLFKVGNMSQIKSGNHSIIVVAIKKFTIPHTQYVAIEIGELNGGRHLLLKVRNYNILKAVPLPESR